MEPPAIRPGGLGINLRIESAVTDFPQPDSPTIPSASPSATSKLMPSSARMTPASVLNSTTRSRMLRTGLEVDSDMIELGGNFFGVERVLQGIGEHIEGDHEHEKESGSPEEVAEVSAQHVTGGRGEHGAPADSIDDAQT